MLQFPGTEPLLELARDSEYILRPEAIETLGWLQERAPVDFLLSLLESDETEVAESAALALSQLGKDAPLPTDEIPAWWRTTRQEEIMLPGRRCVKLWISGIQLIDPEPGALRSICLSNTAIQNAAASV